MIAHYLTHPEVVVDPDVPVPEWGLNAIGQDRSRIAAKAPWAQDITQLWSSDETKALETAQIFADRIGLTVRVHPGLAEIDRSAAGFIPEPGFSQVADACFAFPDQSVRGWEPAGDAQARVVAAVGEVVAESANQDHVLIVGHGGVGAFLFAHLVAQKIDAPGTKPGGYGRVFSFRVPGGVSQGWGDMESGPASGERSTPT